MSAFYRPDTYFRFGVFAQFWVNYAQSGVKTSATDDGGFAIDLYLRRVRAFVFAQWFKNFNMFFLLDSPNMGRGAAGANLADGNLNKTFTPANPPGNLIGDAFFEWKLADDQFMIKLDYVMNKQQITGHYFYSNFNAPVTPVASNVLASPNSGNHVKVQSVALNHTLLALLSRLDPPTAQRKS